MRESHSVEKPLKWILLWQVSTSQFLNVAKTRKATLHPRSPKARGPRVSGPPPLIQKKLLKNCFWGSRPNCKQIVKKLGTVKAGPTLGQGPGLGKDLLDFLRMYQKFIKFTDYSIYNYRVGPHNQQRNGQTDVHEDAVLSMLPWHA